MKSPLINFVLRIYFGFLCRVAGILFSKTPRMTSLLDCLVTSHPTTKEASDVTQLSPDLHAQNVRDMDFIHACIHGLLCKK